MNKYLKNEDKLEEVIKNYFDTKYMKGKLLREFVEIIETAIEYDNQCTEDAIEWAIDDAITSDDLWEIAHFYYEYNPRSLDWDVLDARLYNDAKAIKNEFLKYNTPQYESLSKRYRRR